MYRIGTRRPLTAALTLAALAAALGTASAQTLTTIRANGSPANRVDLVVLGDGYTQSELAKYETDVDAFIAGLFGQSPFAEYRNHFNVHRIDLASAESGADHPSRTPPVFKNTALDGTFDCSGIQRLTCVSLSKVNTVLWSLTTEWHFYLLVPLVALLMRRLGKWTVLAGCIGLTVVWCSSPIHPPAKLSNKLGSTR